jgi:uncharacterized OB-fold protein
MSNDTIHVPGHWDIEYDYSAGETASHFLRTLRDEAQVLGRHCPDCDRVLVPPRGFCERCFVDTDEWVEVGSEGRIESFTVVPEDLGAGPEAPFALAYVQLDGANTAMVNLVEGVDAAEPAVVAEQLVVGTRVATVFDDENDREARITDFHYEVVE